MRAESDSVSPRNAICPDNMEGRSALVMISSNLKLARAWGGCSRPRGGGRRGLTAEGEGAYPEALGKRGGCGWK